MKLLDRNLNIRMRGKDVELLQQELRQLDFAIEDENGYFGSSTRRDVEQFQEQQGLEMTGVVDESTAALINEAVQALEPEPGGDDVVSSFIVRGHVRKADGSPLIGAIVRAFDKDLRHEEGLGEEVTDESGRYEIVYTAAQFRRAEKKRADLIVRVFDQDDQELIASDILFNAQAEETVDLVVGEALSEYDQYMATIDPVREDVPMSELNAENITFLTGETGIAVQRIEFLVAAARLAEQTELPPEVFYGLIRHDLPTTLPELFAQEFWMLHQALETALDENIIPSRLREELEQILAQLRELAGVSPEDDPLHQMKLQPVKVRRIGEAAGLEASKVEAILQEVASPAALSDEVLESLVAVESLQDQEARGLGLTASLYHLFDEDLALANVVKQGTFSQIPEGRVEQIKDLVALEKDDWLTILTAAEAEPPNGIALEEYATLLTKKMEYLYPTDTLLARVIPQDNGDLLTDMERLQPLLERNEFLFGADDSTNLNVEGIDAGEVENLYLEHRRLVRFANMYPGMRIGEILDDRELSAVDKAGLVGERVGLLRTLQEENPELELLMLDYSLESDDLKALNFGEMGPDEQRMVLSTMKAYQRNYSITNDIEDTRSLAAVGYHSALNIVNDNVEVFLENTGLNPAAGVEYYDKAHATVGSTTMAIGSVLDVLVGGFDWTEVGNLRPSIKDFLKKIDGFDDLFGSQDYCHCQHCQSILSPAAYFVDLMYFVEKNILSKHFTGNNADHVLNLEERRPDLWTLPLTCKNTNELMPYLDIINEILENYVAVLGGFPKGQLTDRSKVEKAVYGEALPKAENSFQQPFLLPLEELHLYLSHFGKTQGEIARLLEAKQDIISQTTLKLSKEEYKLIINANTNLTFLEKMYGVQFKMSGSSGKVTAFDARSLLKPMGLTREELADLIKTNFVTAGKSESIQIKGEKTDSKSVQNDIERIYGLTNASLDRMHRFTRLWRAVSSWSITESDLVLSHLDKEKLASGVEEKTLQHVITILAVQKRFSISVEESCALWSELPSTAISAEPLFSVGLNLQSDLENSRLSSDFKEAFKNCGISLSTKVSITSEKESGLWRINDTGMGRIFIVERMSKTLNIYSADKDDLFGRLFNLSAFVLLEKFPRKDDIFIHPSDIKNSTAVPLNNLHHLHRLLAGLQVSDETLYLLITNLSKSLELNSSKGFTLTTAHLSILYRHARLAEWLKLSVSSLFQLIKLTGTIPSGYIENMNDLVALLKFYDWWKTTEYTLDDLGIITIITGGKVQDTSTYLDKDDISKQLLNKVQTDGALTFTDTAFAFLEGVTEEQSRAIVAKAKDSKAIVEASGIRYRLADDFKPTDLLVIPIGISVTEAKLKKLLLTYHLPGAPPFADTLFTSIAGVTKEQSQAIIKKNPSLIVPVSLEKTYWLTDSFKPTTLLIIPSDIPVLETDVRSLLLTYHAAEIIPGYLSGVLGFSAEKTKQLIKIAGADLTEAAYTLALQGKGSSSKLTDLIGKLLPLSVLFKDKSYDAAALKFIKSNSAMFGISDFNALDIQSVHSVSLYHSFVDEEDTTDLQKILLAFDSTKKQFPEKVQDILADILGVARGLTYTLQKEISLPNMALKAFDKLSRCVKMAKYLGVGGDALKLIISQDYKRLAQANAAVLSAFRAKYDDEEEWEQKIEPFENKIRALKRDALADYLIHTVHPEFASLNDLYHHFLIDVELEGCARTSKLVAAISSVQLYVHRCLMNLEQDAQDPDAADRVHILPKDVPSVEWVWRKNYRVWEANRKVFLYPETYIEPELRDNKTPLFEELESELLQKEINKQTALDAYGRYMRGFAEVAHLKIAGSYHDIKAKTDILHLFGVTPGDPPTYYYRTVENAYYGEVQKHKDDRAIAWNPWQKIDVQIPVRKVAPVVFSGQLYVFWVEITTSPKNVIIEGDSTFVGYQHKMALKFTSLRLDGTWTAPQLISLRDRPAFRGEGIIDDLLSEASEFTEVVKKIIEYPLYKKKKPVTAALEKLFTPKYGTYPHWEPEDGYTLTGFLWDQVYPEAEGDKTLSTVIAGIALQRELDFYTKTFTSVFTSLPHKHRAPPVGLGWDRVLYSKREQDKRMLYRVIMSAWPYYGAYAVRSLLLEQRRLDEAAKKHYTWKNLVTLITGPIRMTSLAQLRSGDELAIINGSVEDCIIDSQGDLLLLQGSVRDRKKYLLKRLGTMLSEEVAKILFTGGVDKLLDIKTQRGLKEPSLPISYEKKYVTDASKEGKPKPDLKGPDFKGPYGVYYREIFFHIPFLIANHLNSKQKFSVAQKWYHYIFDPTASEVVDVSSSSLSSEDKKRKQLDRNWRYIEFRDLDIQKLRAQLTDATAIQAYKKDPFNPHAIARLRLSAYQKCIVMKYIDNLLDWGDYLFAQDTMESVNEATLLYILAADILGERPAEIGACGEGNIQPKTYKNIAPLIKKNGNSEFLIEMEHNVPGSGPVYQTDKTKHVHHYTVDQFVIGSATSSAYANINNTPPVLSDHTVAHAEAGVERGSSASSRTGSHAAGTSAADEIFLGENWKADSSSSQIEFKRTSSIGLAFVTQISPVFCVPRNKELALYWDRVEDRLYKIRHCMNIKGVRRQLALFAPEIDPRLLVRAKAAGLSIDDVLSSISGNLPPYRFSYLIEKAKSYAATVQGFGSALLSALEKKDAEELNILRTVHEQNILKLTTQTRQDEIKAADEAIKALQERIEAVTYRQGHFQELVAKGTIAVEVAQEVAQHLSTGFRVAAGVLDVLAGVTHLIPQQGSPFCLKYGGKEVGDSSVDWSMVMRDIAGVSDAIAASTKLAASFERREQEWEHQKTLATHELEELEKQLKGAKIRKEIAQDSLKIHKKTIEQTEDVYKFYKDKFSNLGLYTWLSTTLQRIYREAYNCAYSAAKLAEQAYRFERGDESGVLLGTGYWQSPKAGLLAGERLFVDLQNLERKFIETNYRSLEINQSFSLAQIDPAALMQLREKGTCKFNISEIFFDMFYPGHYRRKIKAVRLTIPCVTGPYTNVSASLTLTKSELRNTPKLGPTHLKVVPRSRSVSIATSSAQNDSGVFELNFRDERYMPFEGGGAISSWQLSLPDNFRQFDYQTISDVILHISYTAEEDGKFRTDVEEVNADIQGTLINILTKQPLTQVYSLRHDFSNALYKLLHNPLKTSVEIEILDTHFPIFLKFLPQYQVKITEAKLILQTSQGQTAKDFKVSINGVEQTGFASDTKFGGLWIKGLGETEEDLNTLFKDGIQDKHTLAVVNAGDLAPDAPASGDTSAIDSQKLADIILYLEYKVIKKAGG